MMHTPQGERGCFVIAGSAHDLGAEVVGAAAAAVLMEGCWGKEIGWRGR